MTKRRALVFLIALIPFTVLFCGNGSLGGVKRVKISTSVGDMYLELYKDKAPKTVNNFLSYVADGFYDGTVFHRVIRGFMVQGGGYDTSDTQKETKKPIKNESDNGLKNEYGTIAMARTGDPDSATSQFFINTENNAGLDYPRAGGSGYTVFGKVIAGTDVLEKINTAPVVIDPRIDPRTPVRPNPAIVITKIEAIGAGDPALAEALKTEADYQAKLEVYRNNPNLAALEYVASLGYDTNAFVTTDSGLKILHVKEGVGATPSKTSVVDVHYEGWLDTGTKFDSSRDRGERIQFGLNQVIPGWTEGLALMKKGGRAILVIPYQLGYGAQGAPPVIPPRATLVFDVELFGYK